MTEAVEELAKDIAIDWLMRRLYNGAALGFAPRQIERDQTLPEEAKAVLRHHVEVIEGRV